MDITLINFMNEQLDLVDLGFKRYMGSYNIVVFLTICISLCK